MVGWSAAIFTIARADYVNVEYRRFDLGNMTQAVWSTAHGRPLEMTNALGEQVSRLSFHVDPILALLAPLWILAPSPLTLVGVQIAACALGAVPVFWLGRRHLGSEDAAALLALSYLAYPWLAWSALDAVHPVTLAIPLFLFAIWFLDSGRLWAFTACAVLAALCGELMGLEIAALGIWCWLAYNRPRAGLAVAAFGVAWSLFAVKVVVPSFAEGPSVYYAHFDSIGGSPEGVLRTGLTDPLAIVSALTSARDLAYLIWLAAPVAAFFLLAPGLAAVALPQLLTLGLSDRWSLTDPRAHYTSVMIPFLFSATVLGVARLPSAHRVRAAALVLVLSVAIAIPLGPPGARGGHSSIIANRESARRSDALQAAVALVPGNAPVSATNAAGSQLSARQYFYSVPVVGRAEWIVVDRRDAGLSGIPVGYFSPGRLQRFVDAIRANPDWGQVFDRDGVLVFRKAGAISGST